MKKSVNERVKEAMKEQGVDLLLITTMNLPQEKLSSSKIWSICWENA